MTTVVGTFSPEGLESYMYKAWGQEVCVRGAAHTEGKIMDMVINGMQVAVMALRTGMVQLVIKGGK